MSPYTPRKLVVALAALWPLLHVQAQTADANSPSSAAAAVSSSTPPAATATPATSPTLQAVTVSASALGTSADDMATPVTVLDGEALLTRQAASLGATLDGQPGIHATHFGAGASRPVIRGLEGPRVRILSDGSEAVSYTHLTLPTICSV